MKNKLELKNVIRDCKAVLFDLDGVITDTMPMHCDAWLGAFKDLYDVTLTREEIYRREGEKCEVSVREMLGRYGISVTAADIEKLVIYKADLFHQPDAPLFFDGMPQFLKSLATHKQVAMVTGTQRREIDRMFGDDFLNLFQAIVTSTDVKNGKPHPEPYEQALSLVGVHPSEALVIENAPLGVRSARQAGISVLVLGTSLPKDDLKEADFFCPDHCSLYASFGVNYL